MTPIAWGLMIVVWSVILAATSYCFFKLLSSERQFGGDE
jgi:hypothetical protein